MVSSMTGEFLEEWDEENGNHVWTAKDAAGNLVARFSSNDREDLEKTVRMWKVAQVVRPKQTTID